MRTITVDKPENCPYRERVDVSKSLYWCRKERTYCLNPSEFPYWCKLDMSEDELLKRIEVLELKYQQTKCFIIQLHERLERLEGDKVK